MLLRCGLRIKHEVVKGFAALHGEDGVVDIIAGASALADVTVDDGVLVVLLAVFRGIEGGTLACFEMHVFVVIVVLEVGVALLGLEFKVALPVLVTRIRAGLTASDEVGHGVKVGRLFSLIRREAPSFGLGVAHGRHAWFDTGRSLQLQFLTAPQTLAPQI
jgi:hypothetical protein